MPLDPLRGILQHDFPRLQFVPDPVCLGPILVLARRGTGRDQSLDFGVEFLLLAIVKEPQHPAQLAEQGSCSPAGAFGGPAGGNEDVDVLGQLEQGGDGVGGIEVVCSRRSPHLAAKAASAAPSGADASASSRALRQV